MNCICGGKNGYHATNCKHRPAPEKPKGAVWWNDKGFLMIDWKRPIREIRAALARTNLNGG